MLIKRDDLSDFAASGNKLRKLEFIFPHVVAGQHDWIISIGGTQSNHCRAVSAVAARLGIPSAHVLRKDAAFRQDRQAEGNLLLQKLFGSKLYLVDKETYIQKGAETLLREGADRLIHENGVRNPYLLPVGGSTVEGVWGYIECIRELELQLESSDETIDDIFFSCGSGGTASGLAIGKYLSTSPKLKNVKLTGYLACDTPEYFHDHVNQMLKALGLFDDGVRSEDIVRFVSSRGRGYSIATDEELSVITQIAKTSGILLDGTYTGKALNGFIKEGRSLGTRSLFIHTGGAFALFDQGGLIDAFVQS